MTPLLHIDNLTVDFLSEAGNSRAVNGVSLQVSRGEIVALVGESGSGKSVTSLSILNLLPQPPAQYATGQILFTETGQPAVDLLRLHPEALRQIRGARIAMIFQEPMTSLNPVLTCGRQVVEALQVHQTLSKEAAKQQTIRWFEKVKLPEPEQLFYRYPHQLSGGQKQRVMIALAMCCEPSLLICDEPTTALDVTVQRTILELIKELQREQGMGVLFITHDLGVVAEIADRVVLLYRGEIVEEGPVQAIFGSPQHPYTKALISCRPAMHPKGAPLPTVSDYLEREPSAVSPPLSAISHQPSEGGSGLGTVDHPDPILPNGEAKQPAQSREALVTVENLSVVFPGKTTLFGKPKTFFTAVDDVSFSVYQNETLGLVGESGCGKTTVGRTLLRLLNPTAGRILYNGNDITQLSKQQLAGLRKEVQLIFQDPYSSLNPRLTIGDAIAEPMLVGGTEPSARERRKKVASLLEKVSLSPTLMNRYPHEFSGGQRQRIVIARALSLNPQFVVCDESVSALDVSVQAQVLNLLNDLKRELGLTLLFISHDLSVVRYMCDRMLVMQAGKIVESGDAEDVYRHPKNPYTQNLLAAVPKIKAND